jgi:hypothetical protein
MGKTMLQNDLFVDHYLPGKGRMSILTPYEVAVTIYGTLTRIFSCHSNCLGWVAALVIKRNILHAIKKSQWLAYCHIRQLIPTYLIRLPPALIRMNHERLPRHCKYCLMIVDDVMRPWHTVYQPHHSQPHCSGQVCKNIEINILITIAFPGKSLVLNCVT